MGLVSSHPIKPRSPQTERILERLRALCLALPEVTEKIAWGEPTWRVHDRLFAQFDNHHHGSPHVSVWLATEPEAQAALLEAEPERFFRPAYVGHRGWVGAILDGECQWDMVAAVLEQAYRRIASKGGSQGATSAVERKAPAAKAKAKAQPKRPSTRATATERKVPAAKAKAQPKRPSTRTTSVAKPKAVVGKPKAVAAKPKAPKAVVAKPKAPKAVVAKPKLGRKRAPAGNAKRATLAVGRAAQR